MKRIMYTAVVFVIFVTILILSGFGIVLANDDEATIDRVRLAFNASYAAGDAKAMGALIDRDAVWMPPTGEQAIVGSEKVVARYKVFFEKTSSVFELQPGKIQICGQWAFINGEWHRKDAAKRGGENKMHGGYYMMVFKKQSDGSWKIARDIWNDFKNP